MLALGKGRREVQGTEGHPILCLMLALVTYDTVSRVGGKQFIQCLHRIDRIFEMVVFVLGLILMNPSPTLS